MSKEQWGNQSNNFRSTRNALTGDRFDRRSDKLAKTYDRRAQLNSALSLDSGVTGKNRVAVKTVKDALENVHVQDWTDTKFIKEILTVINARNREQAKIDRKINSSTIVTVKKEMMTELQKSKLEEKYKVAVERGIQVASIEPGEKTAIEVIKEIICSIFENLATANLKPIRQVMTLILFLSAISIPFLTACSPSTEGKESEPAIAATAQLPEIEPVVATEIVSPTENVEIQEPVVEQPAAEPTETPYTVEDISAEYDQLTETLKGADKILAESQKNAMLNWIQGLGIIGNPNILKSDNLFEITSQNGRTVIRIKQFKISEGEVIEDYCITDPIVGTEPLIFTKTEAKARAKELGISQEIVEVNGPITINGQNYPGGAFDASGNIVLIVSGPSEENPKNSGQWVKPGEAKPDAEKAISEEMAWLLARAEAAGVEGGLPYLYKDGKIIVEDENGNKFEKKAGMNPNDVWEGNFEERLNQFVHEKIKIENYASKELSPTKKTEFLTKLYPVIITGKINRLEEDLHLEVKDKMPRDVEWPTLEAFLIMPNNQNYGIIRRVNLELPYDLFTFYDIKEGQYSNNNMSFFLYEEIGQIEKNKDPLTWQDYMRIADDSIYMVQSVFDKGENTYYCSFDDTPQLTDQDEKNLPFCASLHPQPNRTYALNSEEKINNLVSTPNIANDEEILFPIGEYFIIP